MGKVYKYYHVKPLFLSGVLLFEIGSAICGAAPSSTVFILGRAIAGLGSSGMFSGMMVILFHTVPLHQRPIWQGAFGAVFAVASVIGPLVGGAFTQNVTWRWCFYLNLPIGAISILVTAFILKVPNQKLEPLAEGFIGKFKQLDMIGNLVFFPGIVCLVLALQWGGTTYAWSDARIIVLFILFVVFCGAFIGIQIWKQEEGTVPPRLVKQRSIAASIWYAFWNGAGMMTMMYYLPIYFQAIKNVDAVTSGIMLLPMILSVVVASMASGILVSKLGYYNPFFLLSSIMMPIGAGLLSTLTIDSPPREWIGYQILFGLSLGFGSQQPLNVVQTVLTRADISTGAALIMFIRFLGSAIFLPVAENVFINKLVTEATKNLPKISPSKILEAGATDLRKIVSTDAELQILLVDYNSAIMATFYIVVATSALTIFGSVLVEWRKVAAKGGKK